MPQFLVANYLPDDFDPSVITEAMIEEIHALNLELIAAGVRKFACGISPAVRFLDSGSRRYGRGTRVGAQGCHRLRCARRSVRASFLPGSGTRTRRKQVNNLAAAASEHMPF